MTPMFLLTLLAIEGAVGMEICEYWNLQNRLHEHPECMEVIPKEALASPHDPIPLKEFTRKSHRPAKKLELRGACAEKEVWACRDCEPTCNNQAPLCDRTQCLKGCVCRMGLVRDARGQCVSQRECRVHRKPQHSPSENASAAASFNQAVITKLRSWLPMVNNVWKELMNRSFF